MFNKKFSKTCAALIVSAASIVGIASCSTPVFNVEFMMKNDKGAWEVLETKESSDGKVELAEAPAKKYYTFGGWYNEESFETEFDNANVTSDTKAYAQYVPEEVNIHFNNDAPIVKNLVDLVNDPMKPNDGTTFDGWYKDSNYTLKWNGTDVVTDLYARYVAVVTYNNGYEDVYTTYVTPGKKIDSPAKVVVPDGTETTTLEAKEIVESYMDFNDISYVDAEGKAFDFSKPIEKNTTINVNWNSRGINKYLVKSETSDGYYLNLIPLYGVDEELETAPALSYLSKVTDEEGKVCDVEGVLAGTAVSHIIPTTTEKVIFGEGLKFIKGFNGPVGNIVSDIELPNSLKILDNSFSNMSSLKGIELNEGLEILIGSFWDNTEDPEEESFRTVIRADEYEFNINVPKSVKNIAMVPNNLTFAEGSAFKKENGLIVKEVGEEKTLIADNANLHNRTIVVPEGFTSIQVGTYTDCKFDYLVLPASLKTVSYNEKWEDYKYYQHNGTYDNFLANIKMNEDGTLDREIIAAASYSFANNANGFIQNHPAAPLRMDHDGTGFVIFKGDKKPETLNDYAIVGHKTGYEWRNGKYVPLTDEALNDKVIFKDNVDNIYISLEHFVYHEAGLKDNAYAVIPSKAGITKEEIIAELKKQNSDKADMLGKALEGKDLKFYSNNKEISLADVKGEMFLSAVFVDAAPAK